MKKILIVGGGTGGITVASRLARHVNPASITLIDPSETHYYQPLFTLIGGGIVKKEKSFRPQAMVIPKGIKWIKQSVSEFEPEKNQVKTNQGEVFEYDVLVAAPGMQMDWSKILGLEGHVGKNGIVSIYTCEGAEQTAREIEQFKGGRAIFTHPNTPIKCAGATQKIMWLSEEKFRKRKIRNNVEVVFATANDSMFGVEKYRKTLEQLVLKRDIRAQYYANLIEVDALHKRATFEHPGTREKKTESYDLLHVVPPMSAPDVIKRSSLANQGGWIDVDKYTLQHTKFKNIFALGDASSLPTSRTGAAIRAQAPVVVENLLSAMQGKALKARYNGYASCPLVTARGKCVLAEFGYDGEIMETFPFDQSKERRSMYLLKRYGLPIFYWNFMLKGRA